jgi:hypothetical protein
LDFKGIKIKQKGKRIIYVPQIVKKSGFVARVLYMKTEGL